MFKGFGGHCFSEFRVSSPSSTYLEFRVGRALSVRVEYGPPLLHHLLFMFWDNLLKLSYHVKRGWKKEVVRWFGSSVKEESSKWHGVPHINKRWHNCGS